MTDTKTEKPEAELKVKFLKLVNGESIVVSSKESFNDFKSKQYIEVSDPVEIKNVRSHNCHYVLEHYTMQPWIKMGKTDKIVMPTQSIMVVLDLHDDAIVQYKEYIKDTIILEAVEEIEDEQNMLESEDEQYGEDRKITRKIIH